MSPWAADLFADLDLQACCPTHRVIDYPAGIVAALAAAPPGPWMYVGALENHPSLIDRVAAERPLLGIQGSPLRAVRDPFRLAEVLSSAGFLTPRILRTGADVPRDGGWLLKPIASAGGFRVQHWSGNERPLDCAADNYLQEFIEGEPVGAVYVANGENGWLLGVSAHIIERHPGKSAPFRYCGSIGPRVLGSVLERQFQRLGEALTAEFKLRGLFGVDVVMSGNNIHPLEVNPRYTASVEVLEWACGFSAIEAHIAGCVALDPPLQTALAGGRLKAVLQQAGKRIVYATCDSLVPTEFLEWANQQNRGREWPRVADIPAAGTLIPVGRPICTVLADGCSSAGVAKVLKQLNRKVLDLIECAAQPDA
jgi:predicted ATP-grasp superfamily ATP-dependent carboligase